MNDHELLQSYVRGHSQPAFAALVERYVNLVYSAARRQLHSVDLAEDVTQSVFIELARRAPNIPPAQVLTAWLYVVTRRTALNTKRQESRRLVRETTAAEIAAMKTPPESWPKVAAHLDDAMETLNDPDRTAILLRFFENKSFREVGAALGTSDDAAQKRVSRALDQLRTFFLRRGIAVTAAGLATDLSAHSVQTAPAALCAAISSATITSTASDHGLVMTTAKTIAMTTTQKTIAGATLALVVSASLYQAHMISGLRQDIQSQKARANSLTAQVAQLRQERDSALQNLSKANQQLTTARIEVGTRAPASTSESDPLGVELKAIAARVARFKERFARAPDQRIPELQLLADGDWIDVAKQFHTYEEDEDTWRDAAADLRRIAKANFSSVLREAVDTYLKANFGQLPADLTQLAQLVSPAIDPAILQRYQMIAVGRLADLPTGTIVASEKSLLPGDYAGVVFERDARGNLTSHSGGATGPLYTALVEFAKASGGQLPTSPVQLLPFFKEPVQTAELERQWNEYRRNFRNYTP